MRYLLQVLQVLQVLGYPNKDEAVTCAPDPQMAGPVQDIDSTRGY